MIRKKKKGKNQYYAKDNNNFLSMASRRGISAMTLVLCWTEMIEMPIKVRES